MKTHPLPVYLQRFFTERLVSQLQASSHTVASYRDTFRLLLNYASECLGRMPTDLRVADIDAPLVGHFLIFVETTRGNSARSRNTRLSAIRSFLQIRGDQRTAAPAALPEDSRHTLQAVREADD